MAKVPEAMSGLEWPVPRKDDDVVDLEVLVEEVKKAAVQYKVSDYDDDSGNGGDDDDEKTTAGEGKVPMSGDHGHGDQNPP